MTKPINLKAITKMISYYYLVSFCPPENISELKKSSRKMRTRLAKESGVKMKEFTDLVAPEAARRIVAFQQATRKPEQAVVHELTKLMKGADSKPEKAAAFQTAMKKVAAHPGRAKADKRLHRQKGCDFCFAPCRYGFLTLMCEPDLKTLKTMLDAENKKIAQERDALRVLWTFAAAQIWNVLDAREGFIEAYHLGNLSYCFLMLGTAKSRFALPEDHLKYYQVANLLNIRRLRLTPINIVEPG